MVRVDGGDRRKVAGLGVAVAIAMLAVRVAARARVLLVSGIGMMLAAGLGLEAVQGLFMAAGNEGLGFAVGYHIEELAEDVGMILLIAAAAAATRLSRGAGISLARSALPARPDPDPVDVGR